MTEEKKSNAVAVLVALAVAFALGRWSAPESSPQAAPQAFVAAPEPTTDSMVTDAMVMSPKTQPSPTAAEYERAADIGPADEPAVESVYYRNCSAARAAGAAPIEQGEPGYAPHLDRDGDGVACEG
jgi:excalibur calcium-binding domain-containing protein